jgi:hypothetical protein
VLSVTTNSEVNAFAAHVAHDAFGVARAYPALGNPSRGAGPALLQRVGGRLAFGRPVDVRALDVALDAGTARLRHYAVPDSGRSRSGRQYRSTDLPDAIIAIARARAGSVEVVTPQVTWQAGDELVILTLGDETETRVALDGVHDVRASGDAPDAAQDAALEGRGVAGA